MELRKLQRTHADYDPAMLARYHDIVAGGIQFQRNVKHYLPKHDVEPASVYKRRCDAAHYLGYVSPIVHYFASWLFSSPLTFESDPADSDEFWSAFKEDTTGRGVDLDQFLRARFLEAVTERSSYWRVQLPDPSGVDIDVLADYEAAGLGRATLDAIDARCITNWRCDDDGRWLWVLEHHCDTGLDDLADEYPTTRESWTQWFADGTAKRWEADYQREKRPIEIPEVAPPYNPCRAIPIVQLTMPDELWIVNHLASGQLEHFRKSNALSWSIDRTCYAMPYFFLKDRRKPPDMGAGYYGILGIEEKVEWPAPPAAPFQTVQEYMARLKDELHRVTHQMAMGVENNAAAVGRSGASKQADNAATEIVLSAFGRVLREPVEQTFDLISRARARPGQKASIWYIGGMDKYKIHDSASILADAVALESMNIPSATLRRENFKRAGLAVIVDADEGIKETVVKEIDEGVSAEEFQRTPVDEPDGDEIDPNEPIPPGAESPDPAPPAMKKPGAKQAP
jgi:hypothetical protein